MRPAIIQQASNIIIVHNHPSGDAGPSPDDIRLTRRLAEAGSLLDIGVVDHVIIAGATYRSCRESGLMSVVHEHPDRLSEVTYGPVTFQEAVFSTETELSTYSQRRRLLDSEHTDPR